MIVLSSDTTVKEVLDKRSGNYSDRPDMFIGQKVASGDLRLVVMVSRRQIGYMTRVQKGTSKLTIFRDTETTGA